MAIDYSNLAYGQQYFPEEVDETVTETVYPNKPFLYGDLNPYRSETEKFRTRFDPTQIQAAPEKRKFSLNPLDWGVMGLMKRMVEPNTPEENFGRGYFKDTMDSSGRVYNDAGDLFGGKNVVSAWGEGMGAAAQKRIDKINETLSKWESDEEKYARQLANTTLYDRRKKFQRQLAEYNKDLAADKAAAEAASKKQWQAAYSNWQSPSGRDHAGTAGIGSRESRAGGAPGTSRGEASWKGYLGGRAGYREGELVEQDVNIQGPDFDINEQMAGYIDPMDALNDMSMDIFGKPLNLLNEEEYQMLIDMANDQAMAEQPEGLASLV